MRFTVIIPTLNPGASIDVTLESLRAQGTDDWECLVMDGGSSDGTIERLDGWKSTYAGRLRYRSEADGGVYAAMNAGVREARGQYFYFLGAGDRILPGVLARVSALCTGQDEILYGDVRVMTDNRLAGGEYPPLRTAAAFMYHQGIFYHRRLFERFGPYNESYPVFADAAFNVRVAGAPDVRRRYLALQVAEYQGGGLSAGGKDPQFATDLPGLARESLGADGETACVDSGFALDVLLRCRSALMLDLMAHEADDDERDAFVESIKERGTTYDTKVGILSARDRAELADATVVLTTTDMPAVTNASRPLLRATYTVCRPDLCSILQQQEVTGVWLFGTGFAGRQMYWQLRLMIRQHALPVKLLGFFDNSPTRWGQTLHGLPVLQPELAHMGVSQRVIVASSFWLEIREGLIEDGFAPEHLLPAV